VRAPRRDRAARLPPRIRLGHHASREQRQQHHVLPVRQRAATPHARTPHRCEGGGALVAPPPATPPPPPAQHDHAAAVREVARGETRAV